MLSILTLAGMVFSRSARMRVQLMPLRLRRVLRKTLSSRTWAFSGLRRSEEHTSELQSLRHLVCRLLLEKKSLTSLNRPWSCPNLLIVRGSAVRQPLTHIVARQILFDILEQALVLPELVDGFF